MVCPNCRTQNSDGSKFCINCGKPLVLSDIPSPKNQQLSIPKMSSTKLVPAKCTSCGAALTVDPKTDAAICPFCNSAFIVEKAIQGFTTYNVKAHTVEINNPKQDNEWSYKTEKEKSINQTTQESYKYLPYMLITIMVMFICLTILILSNRGVI